MKGEKMMLVLEKIEQGIYGILDITEAISSPKTHFGSSLSKTLRYIEKNERERESAKIKAEELQRIRVIIAKLAREGIVEKNKRAEWSITKAGKKKLQILKARFLCTRKYEVINEKTIKIVMFDIPERYRNHRDWIRSALRTLKYEMLQKSVFAGTVKIPELFIADLDQRTILHHVQIFAVGRHGTLEDYMHTYHAQLIQSKLEK